MAANKEDKHQSKGLFEPAGNSKDVLKNSFNNWSRKCE